MDNKFFTRKIIIRLPRLLDMMYKPSEIAAEIEVTTETVMRSYLPEGAPFERDAKGAVWIHGKTFAAWVRAVNYKQRKIVSLLPGQGWCCRCNAAVEMIKPRVRHRGRYVTIMQGKCPACGAKVNRGRKRDESDGGIDTAPGTGKPAGPPRSHKALKVAITAGKEIEL